jgi:hypothetical protein
LDINGILAARTFLHDLGATILTLPTYVINTFLSTKTSWIGDFRTKQLSRLRGRWVKIVVLS